MRYDMGRFRRPMRNSTQSQAMAMAFPGGTKVFGSARPTQFFNDVASGKDSLDILLLGDSNTGSAISDFWGYHNGLSEAMNARGWKFYGTPLLSGMSGRSINNAPSLWRGSINYFAPTGSLLSGNTSGGSTAYSVWSPTGNWTRYGSSTSVPDSRDNWAYISAATQYYQTFGIQINSDNPLATSSVPVYYRIRYGTFTTSGGGFCPMVFNGSGTEQFSPRQFQSSTGAAYSYTAWEKSWQPTGTTSYRGTWSFVGTGSDVCKGPMAIANQSFYRREKGWSITSHAYLGGFSSDAIAGIIVNSVPATLLQSHLQELRERQILAGGTGRVLVMYQAGVNQDSGAQPESASKWVQAARDIWTTYKTAWDALGYPADDLACLFWCSHQMNQSDTSNPQTVTGNMIAVRAAANQMALDYPDMTVVDVKQLLPYSKLIMGTGPINSSGDPDLAMYGLPYYQRVDGWPNAGTNFYEHLSGGQISAGVNHPTDGYRVMSESILSAVLSR